MTPMSSIEMEFIKLKTLKELENLNFRLRFLKGKT